MKNLAHKTRLNRIVISIAALAVLLVLPIANVPAALSAPLASTVTIPNLVGFEGYLTDGTGQPISDGAHNLAFRVYSVITDPPASALWVETQTVTVTTGLYSALLGSVTTLTNNLFNSNRWIGVTVDAGTEITPRTQVASVPFALNAEHANSTESVDWTGVANKPTNLVTGSGANGQLTLWNGTNTVTSASGLTYSGNNLSVSGGLNMGTASGATAGQIRASGTVTGSNLSGINTGDATKAGENYLSLSGQAFTANAVDLSGTNATGILAALRFPALTGDVSTSLGSLATSIGSHKVANTQLAQMPTNTIKGTNNTGPHDAADLTVAQVNTMLGTVTGSGTSTQLAYFNGPSSVTSSGSLTTDGSSVTMNGGLNVNTTGATAGQIKSSGDVLALSKSTGLQAQLQSFTVVQASGAVNLTTTFQDATGVTTTFTAVSGGEYMVLEAIAYFDFSVGTAACAAGDSLQAQILVDGVLTGAMWAIPASGASGGAEIPKWYKISLAAGSHTIKMQVKNNNGPRGSARLQSQLAYWRIPQ